MNLLLEAQEIHFNNVLEFQKACLLYKSMLDKNYGGRFCIGDHCATIWQVEIKFDGSEWGATPKTFQSKEEAEKEAEALKSRYPFLSECRVITRRMKEKTD